ncbi:MAG TPA: ABC transporter permease, partial [Gemmatimonadaceae bacterium]
MRRAIGSGLGRGRVTREVDDELAFHLEMRTRQLIERGLSPEDARREALRQFGDLDGVRRDCITLDQDRIRSMNRSNLLDELRRDLVYGARMLHRNPGVTAVVTLTLALGIGANTAIFSLVDAVLLRPLPVRAPDELIVVGNPARPTGISYSTAPRGDLYSYPSYRALRERNTLTTGLLATGRADRVDVWLTSDQDEPDRPRGRFVSGNFFQVLGVPAFLGRTFDGSEDEAIGASPVATISHGYWQRRFAGDSSVVGRDILINGVRFTIIGVTPPSFSGVIVGQPTDIWLPLTMQGVLTPYAPMLEEPQAYWLLLMGRRAPGVTYEQAVAGFTSLARQILNEQAPNIAFQKMVDEVTFTMAPGARGLSRLRLSYQTPLLILLAGTGLLLLIICANVANLLLARAVARAREMSVRLAIGADRGRLIRQMLTEGLLLAFLGGAAGLVVARWGSRFLLALAADGSPPIPVEARLDLIALGFTLLLSIIAVSVFGLAPALRASNVDLASTMRATARGLTGSLGARHQRHPLGRLLIPVQVALSFVLLIGAALLVRSLRNVETTDTGVARDRLILVDLDPAPRGVKGEAWVTLARDLAERARRVAGVEDATYSVNGLFSGTENASNLGVPGFQPETGADSIAYYDLVGPGFVQTIGGRLLRGRDIAATDVVDAPLVILVNEAFAKFYFGDRDPVGTTIRVGDSTYAQIVGVVADVRDHSLTDDVVRRYYAAYDQLPYGD